MTAIPAFFAQALLLLAVLCARPARPGATRSRLLVQAGLLSLFLLARAAIDRSPLPIACLVLLLAEAGLLLLRGTDPRDAHPVPTQALPLWPWAAAMLSAWLAYRLLPFPGHAATAAAVGIVLSGLVSLLATRDDHARQAGLLTAGHGALLFVAAVPGPGWPALLMVALPQAALLTAFCARPASTDRIGTGAP